MDIEIPGYQLIRTIGKGGMATVFLAKQSVLERKVALKVMSKALAEESSFGERFMREARIVSQLVHPNIVTVHEVGQHEGRYFLSMEYIDGHDLRTVSKRLDILGKIRAIEDVARALHYAGEKGYVHRDIKPENIMFRAADGSAVLTDFGIAKAVKSDLSMTQTGTAIGTPHYMSPEQAKGKSVDHRSDLYSLGIVFYQLLTGKVPYDAETAVAIGIKHITEPLPVLPRVYAQLQPILDGLLAKSVGNRYQNGLALLNDLRRIDLQELKDTESAASNEHDDDALTVLTGPQVDDDEEDGTDRFTIEFDVSETIERPLPTVWPTIIASVFVLFVVLLFVYLSRPPVLEPVIAKIEEKSHSAFSKLNKEIERGADFVETKAKEYVPEVSAPADASAQQDQVISNAIEPEQVDTFDRAVTGQDNSVKPIANPEQQDTGQQIVEQTTEEIVEATEALDLQPEIDPVDLRPLEQLLAERDLLEKQAKLDKAMMPLLVDKLYQILDLYPDDRGTTILLYDLIDEREKQIFDNAERGKKDVVEGLLAQHRKVFAKESQDLRMERERKARSLLRRVDMMALAQTQLEAQKVSVPQGDNAVETLKSVVSEHPVYQPALSLLEDISKAYFSEAQTAYRADELNRAKLALDRALNAQGDNSDAVALSIEVEQALSRIERLNRRLQQAEAYSEHGFLYTPEGANAYDEYQAALLIDADNAEAREGLAGLLDKLSVQIWELVGEARFDEARGLLLRPLSISPDNERLMAMRAAIDEAQP